MVTWLKPNVLVVTMISFQPWFFFFFFCCSLIIWNACPIVPVTCLFLLSTIGLGILSIDAQYNSVLCQQFANGIHSKFPAYLGGISVFVCFVTASVSLALAFAVTPRQVMPWTGLLLMYEWTFASLFILFGMFLHLVYEWGKATTNQAGVFFAHVDSSDYNSGKGLLNYLSFLLIRIFPSYCLS